MSKHDISARTRYYGQNTDDEEKGMYKTWSSSASDPEVLARSLEAHLNEFAQDVVSVSYSVSDRHYVLVVYREIMPPEDAAEEQAIAIAEQIIDGAGP